MLRWLMRLAPVRGDHAQQAAGAGDQRRGLHGADARLAIGFEVLGAGHEVAQFDIRHNRPLAGASATPQVLPDPGRTHSQNAAAAGLKPR